MSAPRTGKGSAAQDLVPRAPDTAAEWLARLWLARFASNGGWWVVGAGGRVSFGWMVQGYSVAQNAAAADLWDDLQRNPDKLSAVRDYLRRRHSCALLATRPARA